MVGVVGSSPIVPTKSNPRHAGLRGAIRKGRPFLFSIDFQYFFKTPHHLQLQLGAHALVLNALLLVSGLVVLGHLHVGMAHQRLDVLLGVALLFI
ncbi:hypothetical protein D9M68_583870 [compost metagenome]